MYNLNSMFKKIKFFKDNFPEYFTDMVNSEHAENQFLSNPYHIEGNVWTHTMCVCSHLQSAPNLLQWAGLLHDIGKPDCRKINDFRVSFFSHGGYGIFKALEVLKLANIPEKEIKIIIRLIAKHQDLYLKGTKNTLLIDDVNEVIFYEYLKELTKADSLGAMSEEFREEVSTKNIFQDFTDTNNYKNEIIVMIGVPNSGKSYSLSNYDLSNYTVISRDDLLFEVANLKSNKNLSYNESWKYCTENDLQKEIDKTLLKNFNSAYRNKENIIVDMTNLSKKSRNKFVAQVKDYKKIAHLVLSDYKTILNRNLSRGGKFIQEDIIKTMMKRFTFPDYSQFSEIKFEIN